MSSQPLRGTRVLEFAGLGAAPFACSLLADAGADVIRVERPGANTSSGYSLRGRTIVSLDLKDERDAGTAADLARAADVLVEGFRPGVMERLGFGPELLVAENPRLVYGRMTGWGQDGPRANQPGHDLNYLAITGVARSIAREGEDPVPPLNVIGDYGGGLLLAYGLMTALLERSSSGRGQVVDTAMVDAGLLLMSGLWQRVADGKWTDIPGTNDMDSGAPFYNSYRTSDDQFMAVACIEPQFYRNFVNTLGEPDLLDAQWDRSTWRERKRVIAKTFRQHTRQEWAEIFADAEACVTPLNAVNEVRHDPHIVARQSLIDLNGDTFPAAAPRLSRSSLSIAASPRYEADIRQALERWQSYTQPKEAL